MKKIAKYLGGGPDSDEQMMKVYEFETKLAMVCSQRFENVTKKRTPEILLHISAEDNNNDVDVVVLIGHTVNN